MTPPARDALSDEALLQYVRERLPNGGLVGELTNHPDRHQLVKLFRDRVLEVARKECEKLAAPLYDHAKPPYINCADAISNLVVRK